MQKRQSYHFFHFTKKEKNGTLFILFIILLLIAFPFFYSFIFKETPANINEFKNEMDVLKTKAADTAEYTNHKDHFTTEKPSATENNYSKHAALSPFYFDPNTLSTKGWTKMGLREKAINTIQNYVSKGGRFKEPGDLKKIWGLHEDEVTQLLPYIRIQPLANADVKSTMFDKPKYPVRIIPIIDVNTADSLAYDSLPGIGPGFARRIIKFRDKLGGFYSAQQISETYGLPDSAFEKIKSYLHVSGENIKKININIATAEEMKEHPYIRYQLANAIVQYRTQHGHFNSIEDIKKIMLVTEDVFVKLSPYLTIN